ncbi:MAG TPA: DUF1501 domain-containing protein [Candidatus Dormibacteraeota bacterium]|nr:DUF1501 domain-containing protein [Candidatus Dormibacteraeota bacterium]
MDKEVGINQLKRRDFLKAGLVFGAGASGLAAGYAAVPDAFARAVYAAKKEGTTNENILVMIQLAGGNDGLRTLVPLADPALHDLRPKLAGPMVAQALPLNSQYGLNHNLGGIKKLWDGGKVAIVQGVGYPNPTFSHFESIRIWETGDPTRRQVDGWLGRTLATNYDSNGHPLTGCACGATDAPGALRDLQATLTVIQNQKNFGFTGGSEVEAAVGALYKGTPGIYGALFDTAIATATETMVTLRTSASTYRPMADYTDKVQLVYSSKNQLAAALQLAAELIVTGTGVKLLHVTLGGFDTHYTELNRHDDLMGYLDSAVSAFYQDLAAHNMADKVMIATWSEFGRRPKENASGGTDHGAAAPLLLIGDPVKGGLYGEEPSLTSLDNTGNLRYSVDFRSVYQEILSGHLGADSAKILGATFDKVQFLKTPVAV